MSEDQVIDVTATEVVAAEAPKPDITAEEAEAVLEAKLKEKLAACEKEVQAVLEKYQMSLMVPQVIQIVPKK